MMGSRRPARAPLSSVADAYTLEKCLAQSVRSDVWAAVRESDGREVVLKAYASDRGKPLAETRAQSERTLLRAAAAAGVPELLELVAQDPPVLVLERVPGIPLSEWLDANVPPDIGSFLEIALQLVSALTEVHAAHVIHRDVSPENIVIDPGTLRVHLVDFSAAHRLGAATRPSGTRGSGAGATSRYVAPEQTGWLKRGCDPRSDLYSLGATLYHLLTGSPPFEGSAVELIHAHIARVPRSPGELRPGIPKPLGRLILKLLRKEPEERYRSARALELDLRAMQAQHAQAGGIEDDFELAASEAPASPRFSGKAHGRDEECTRLARLFEQAAAGQMQAIAIRGEAGIGKSTLVDSLRPHIAERRAYLALGKFELGHERPYAAWVSALESLVQQLLVESDADLQAWRVKLREALGSIAQALVEVVPDLALVLGEVPPVPALGPSETQARLGLALQRLIHACARPEHPLAIFLDDLQWADAGSLFLLEELLSGDPACALLWIGAQRSTGVAAEHAFARVLQRLAERGVFVERMDLHALTSAAALTLLSEALARPPEAVWSIAALIERKTANVPLLLCQFVEHIHERGFLRYQPGCGWTWDAQQIAAADIPDGAVELMTAKIARLTPALRGVLQLASCIGAQFDVEILAALGLGERTALVQQLYDLCDAGLLAPCSDGFRFAHDRIRESARAFLSEGERERLHHEIGSLLLERTPEEERAQRAFEIVDQLNRALSHVGAELRPTLLRLNQLAGGKAMAAGAAVTAAQHFAVARGLFAAEDWQASPQQAFALHVQSAECAFQVGDFAQALALLDALEQRPLAALEACQIAVVRSRVFALTRDPEECARYMLAALERFGIHLPLHPSRRRVRRAMRAVQRRLAARADGAEIAEVDGPERDWIAPILVFSAASGPVVRADIGLAMLTNCYSIQSVLRHGRLISPSYVLAVFASFSYMLTRDARSARRVADVALEWTRRAPDPVRGPRTEFQLQTALYPWWMPRRLALAPLPRITEAIRELGDREFVNYARFLVAAHLVLVGDPVAKAQQRMRDLADSVTRSGHRYPAPAECHAVVQLLLEPAAAPLAEILAVSDRRLASDAQSAEPYVRTLWMMILCVYGRHDLALAQSNAIGERLFRVAPYVHVADHTFYRGLACATLAGQASWRAAWRLRWDLWRSQRRLRRWAKDGPDFVHMETLLRAELARLRGDTRAARALYEGAAQRALEQQYPHHAALAHEHQGRMLAGLRRETEASASFAQAIALYRAWGAEAKAAELARERRSIK